MCKQVLNLGYFPALLVDELLCSYLARLAAFNGLGTTRFYEYFIGRPGTLPITDLPANLTSLQKRLDQNSPFDSVIDMILRATIYPYHRVFLSPERNQAVMKALRRGHRNNPKATLGRLANRFGANPTLRFCPVCVQDDYKSLGSPYWRRTHQLPGVVACPHHGCCLQVLDSAFGIVHRTQLLLPPLGTSDFDLSPASPIQQEFATLSSQLLRPGLGPHNPNARADAYYAAAISKGFYAHGHLNFADLAIELRTFYDDFIHFQHRERLLSTAKTPLAWLRPLFCRPYRSCHPICHLLLIQFLFASIENFYSMLAKSSASQEQLTQSYHPETSILDHDLTGDPTQSCRATAQKLGLSTTTVTLRRCEQGIPVKARPKTLCADKVSKIVEAIQAGLAFEDVAKTCGVSISTVYRQRRIHHLQGKDWKARSLDTERNNRRAEWITAVAEHEYAGIKRVRSDAGATYAWLYRNDRQWLRENCSTTSLAKIRPLKVDWNKRDSELCEKLQLYVENLRSEQFRPRVSKALMLNHIGESTVRSNLDKLPKTFALMMNLEESVLDNQIRRIDLFLSQMGENNFDFKIWKIQRLCGIREWTDFHTNHLLKKYYKYIKN